MAAFDAARYDAIVARHRDIHAGRRGRWFDAGEYEDLVRRFFDEDVPVLIEIIAALRNQNGRLRAALKDARPTEYLGD